MVKTSSLSSRSQLLDKAVKLKWNYNGMQKHYARDKLQGDSET